LEALDGLPLDVTLHHTSSGIAAMLTGARPGPTVLLRGDMDALPLQEHTGESCSSQIDGAMHACGNDGHTAMLVSAAHVLSGRRGDLAGRVLFMFQPGEENCDRGALHMLDEGLLELSPHAVDGSDSPVTAAYALHLTPNAPTGVVVSRAGPLMASSDRFTITVVGRGGHASDPSRALDPIPVACEIVQALQTMVTRSIDVFDPGLVTVGRISAGTTNNIIPETAVIEGTLRAVSRSTRQRLHDGLQRIADGVAAAHGAQAEVDLMLGYGVTINDAAASNTALAVAADLLGGAQTFRLPHPTMGSEDFSYVIDRVPGAMLFLGCTPHEQDYLTAATNHSDRVVHDEAALPMGVALHVALALEHLSAS
ncbi:MAG: M20 family metallopeptidase, partial [Ilumatobacteraceae bacterium]|nr:M20 family metallopeptidase [Ilumatobacteraceae bacterium]